MLPKSRWMKSVIAAAKSLDKAQPLIVRPSAVN